MHLGKQYMFELVACNKAYLDDVDYISAIMIESAAVAGVTVVQQFFHQFSPYGVSGTVVIAESHINIHTWPEHNYAAVDIFTCGDQLKAERLGDFLKEKLGASEVTTQIYNRGDITHIKKANEG